MLKTFSAVLIAASIFAAPAMAATVIKTERAPATKSVTIIKTVKPSVANARAQTLVVKKHRHHRMHRHHVRKHVGAVVTKKVIVKRVSAASPVKTIIVKKKS